MVKEILLKLLNDYYTTDSVIRNVIITERNGKQTIQVILDLAANAWRVYEKDSIMSNGVGRPDYKKVDEMNEERRRLKARQIFEMTVNILIQQDKQDEWNTKRWRRTVPASDIKDHILLVNYAVGALYFTKVLSPHEYEELQQIVDQSGILIGSKLMPKKPENEFSEFMDEESEKK